MLVLHAHFSAYHDGASDLQMVDARLLGELRCECQRERAGQL